MLNIRNLKIDPASLGAKKLLVDIAPVHDYRDNQRLSEIIGYRYIVALPEHSLEKVGVKILGKQLLEKPESFVEVEFSGLELSVYMSDGKPMVTARATAVTLAKPKA